MGDLLRRHEAAERAGISAIAFDADVKAGKISPAGQTSGGEARYDSEEIDAAYRIRPSPSEAKRSIAEGIKAIFAKTRKTSKDVRDFNWYVAELALGRAVQDPKEALLISLLNASFRLEPDSEEDSETKSDGEDWSARKAFLNEVKAHIAKLEGLENAVDKRNSEAAKPVQDAAGDGAGIRVEPPIPEP